MKVSSGLRRIGLIGHGAIGQEITGALGRLGEEDRLAAALVRQGRSAPAGVHSLDALIDSLVGARPGCVIECAGQAAAARYGPGLLEAGIDLILSSVGILADDSVTAALLDAEHRGGGRLLLPAGAIAGLDGLVAAALAGIDHVTYSSHKPPHAWQGTPAERLIDLDHDEDEIMFFEGSARRAASDYPKNANVAVAVGLAGIGIDDTRVRLVSSRKVDDPLGVIEAEGKFGRFRFDILALAAPDNPKTSALTAYSLLQCARLEQGLPISALIQRKSNIVG
ncbi:aspartate dehydrogenase [Pacificimonas flava]|uniref:L-aspartate dehydrogenase n=2 Tax=Pacificimonas TaxID=1960290 RepID=A0A219B442_9SPHN|nr:MULTISPECIES: aspartate dehydrogenase [Pacificimonas]MBZ6377152.1 aspartate dehydrogenase [Pacificimonas aurantium]OWV33125.1 aspartate dehydrogenase [Pacificimonas flava]